MDFLDIQGIKFHKIDDENDIKIEVEGWGWSVWLSIEEAIDVIDFFKKQVGKEQLNKCYHPLTERKHTSDIHFECTICGYNNY